MEKDATVPTTYIPRHASEAQVQVSSYKVGDQRLV